MRLVDRGRGPPVLLLHGNPDSAELWAGVIARLGPRFRCLAPDLPGFGRSAAPDDLDRSPDGMARFVAALLAAAGVVAPVHLVVHDLGGPYGLAWAVRHPARVRRIAVITRRPACRGATAAATPGRVRRALRCAGGPPHFAQCGHWLPAKAAAEMDGHLARFLRR